MIPPIQGQDALPHIERSALPPELRKASEDDKKLYRTALGFERVLLNQLLESMTRAAKAGDEDSEGDAAGGAYASLVPSTMADSLVQRGGTGLARDLYRTFDAGGGRR